MKYTFINNITYSLLTPPSYLAKLLRNDIM